MKFQRLGFVAALLAGVALVSPLNAQVRPSQFGPVYSPVGILAPQSMVAAAGSTAYVLANESSVLARITGTFSGMTGTFQVSNDAVSNASPTWTTVSVEPVGGGGAVLKNITTTGLYRVPTSGAVRVRFNLTAITVTGSNALSLTLTGGLADHLPGVGFTKRATYTSSGYSLTPATSLTNLITLAGSATTTVRVLGAACDGVATATGVTELFAVKRSTADSGGTPVGMTTVPYDTGDPAASATITAYSANPTVGTAVGVLYAGQMFYNIAATTSLTASPWVAKFGSRLDASAEGVTLRGVAQSFSIWGNGVSQPSGAAINCTVTWTEE